MSAITLKSSCQSLANGTTAVSATQQAETALVAGTWAAGDKLGLILTDGFTGTQTIVGNGNATGVQPKFLFTYNKKLYMLAGATVYFSAISSPTVFNSPSSIGNSFLTLSNIFNNAEDVIAIALFQGKLAFYSRRTVQLWDIDPDPTLWKYLQTLQNCGTVAALSVQSIGELETLALADNGFRSIRARANTNNGEVNDLGTPIDTLVVAKLAASTATQRGAACGIVEPSSNRYWCFLNDTIYVLSYFQSSQIVAWSTYLPTYQTTATASGANYVASAVTFSGMTIGAEYQWTPGAHESSFTCGTSTLTAQGFFTATATTAAATGTGATVTYTGTLTTQTAFTPSTFVVLNGQVFCRDGDALYAYGGSDGVTYDRTSAVADTPFLDTQSPASGKPFYGIDVAQSGSWLTYVGTNLDDSTDVTLAYNNTKSSYAGGKIKIMRRATHLKMRFKSYGSGAAVVSKGITHFGDPTEK